MAQDTAFGDAQIQTLFKVQKASGEVKYYKVVEDTNIEITAEEYTTLGGE